MTRKRKNESETDFEIRKEKEKNLEIFKDIDENKKKFVEPLIDQLSFYVVTFKNLQSIVNEEGQTMPYDNGGGQTGVRENPNAKAMRECSKHVETITRQLVDLVPATAKKSKLEELMKRG